MGNQKSNMTLEEMWNSVADKLMNEPSPEYDQEWKEWEESLEEAKKKYLQGKESKSVQRRKAIQKNEE